MGPEGEGAASVLAEGGEETPGGEGGGNGEGWIDQLPEELRGAETLKKFTDPGALAKSYVELEGKIGTAVQVPGNDATPEEVDAFNARVRPESAEAYELPVPENLPEGLAPEPEFLGEFKGLAHKIGLSQRQAASLNDWWNGMQVEAHKAQMVQQEEARADMEKDFGPEFEKIMANAKRFITGSDDPEVVRIFFKTAMGNNKHMIRFFARIQETMGESTGIKGDGGGGEGGGAGTPEQIQEKINAIMNQEDHPYHHTTHAGHLDAKVEMRKLYEDLHLAQGHKVERFEQKT